MFIVNVVQHIKIGDLSAHQGGVPFTGDSGEDRIDVDDYVDQMPDDLSGEPSLSREEEISLTRDSTSGFAGTYALPFALSLSTIYRRKIGLSRFSVGCLLYTRIFLKREVRGTLREAKSKRAS